MAEMLANQCSLNLCSPGSITVKGRDYATKVLSADSISICDYNPNCETYPGQAAQKKHVLTLALTTDDRLTR